MAFVPFAVAKMVIWLINVMRHHLLGEIRSYVVKAKIIVTR